MLNIERLKVLSGLSIHNLAKLSGMSYHTLGTKIRFGRELKVNESQLLEKVLRDYYNIKIIETKYGVEVKDDN